MVCSRYEGKIVRNSLKENTGIFTHQTMTNNKPQFSSTDTNLQEIQQTGLLLFNLNELVAD